MASLNRQIVLDTSIDFIFSCDIYFCGSWLYGHELLRILDFLVDLGLEGDPGAEGALHLAGLEQARGLLLLGGLFFSKHFVFKTNNTVLEFY